MLRSALFLATLSLVACGGGGGSSTSPDAAPDAAGTDPDARPMSEVEQCAASVPSPASGICAATGGAGDAVAIRGTVLGDGTTYLDGEVVYEGAEIVCVGCDCAAAPGRATATVIDCGDAVISPGLINAHDHLNYNNRAPLASTALGGQRYEHRHGWRQSGATPNNQHGTSNTSDGMRWNELRQLLSGTTAIAGSTRADGLVRNLDEPEGREEDQGLDRLTYAVFALGDGNEQFRDNCGWNYAYSETEVEDLHGLITHTSEGINDYAHEEFRCQSRSTDGAEDFTEGNVAHIHGIGLFADDYFNMVRDDAKLIWSPRSNVSLYGMTAQVPVMARLGGTIALGTDWTYSGSATINREMACADYLSQTHYDGAFSAEDIWRMATIDAARATRSEARIGSLAAGKLADLAVFRAAPGELHQAVIDALSGDVALVVQGGLAMAGEGAVVDALESGCEPVTICGATHRICTAREMGGRTFAQVAAEVDDAPAAYPAIFCEVPADEPTCVPSRPNQYAGPTAADQDGDGLDDNDDLCPTVFDPIRPIDDGAQADDDGDGIGDACDPTPVAEDVDNDGVANNVDLCPFAADPSQTDGDSDGRGDACDRCPESPNPDTLACPGVSTTIGAVRDGSQPIGADVTIAGAIVTGVASNGFAMQDPTVPGGANAGLFVFTGAAPGVTVGQEVTVSGTVGEYFDNLQLANADVVSQAAGTPITPVVVSVAQAATEPYEGVLVTVNDAASIERPYSCAADVAICADPDLFEIADTLVGWDEFYSGGDWVAEIGALGVGADVTGVMFYRFERRRILPRTAADLTP